MEFVDLATTKNITCDGRDSCPYNWNCFTKEKTCYCSTLYFRDDEEAGCTGRSSLQTIGIATQVLCILFNIIVFVETLRLIFCMKEVGVFKRNASCISLVFTVIFNVAILITYVCYLIMMTTTETDRMCKNVMLVSLGIQSLFVMPTILTIPIQWIDIALSMSSTNKKLHLKRFKNIKRFLISYSVFFGIVGVASVFLQRNDIVSMLIVFSIFVATFAYQIGADKLARMLESGAEASKVAAKNMRVFNNRIRIAFVFTWLPLGVFAQIVGKTGNSQIIMFFLQVGSGSMIAALYFNLTYVRVGVQKKLKSNKIRTVSTKVSQSPSASSSKSSKATSTVSPEPNT
ncbi:hypothetical protein TrVE_jg2468 [Triparma verrucosa]|uniref:Uncharacterized protein n=1 Tax=Triparma verrucosa TaxID=1606542 RepID=A0A9W7FNT5_9STRA|nr:hypothetical protein TrVE_jg2468 [Triparma verrucosa]